MATLSRSDCAIKPSSVIPFFDVVQFWRKSSITGTTFAELRQTCGHVHVRNGPARFNPSFRQRLQLKQPSDAALLWLAGQQEVLINAVEIAVDYAFANADEQEQAHRFFSKHVCRRWHGRRQEIRIHPGRNQTRYDASRSANNGIVFYKQDFSRQTGELDVVHLEWRANRLAAVRAAGIRSPQDVLDFDHRAFWEKRLLLYDIEPARVGRFLRNRRAGSRRRNSNYRDQRAGGIVVHSCATVQELLDRFAWLRRLMTRISPDPFLPLAAAPVVSHPPTTTQLRNPACFRTNSLAN